MASITGIITPNTVQENSSGSPITVPNIQKDDFLVIIASAGGTSIRPGLALSGISFETLADTTSTPSYEEYTTTCVHRWWGWPWWRYYWPYYYWNGYCHWYYGWYYGYCGYYYCSVHITYHMAMTRVMWIRADEAGTLTATATMSRGSISNFRVYHFRAQTQASAGKAIDKVSWVLRTPQAQGSQSSWRQRSGANDFILTVAAGNRGGTISATPSGASVTNLLNYTFTHGDYVRILVRLDWVTSDADITYAFTNADVSQFIAGYSVDLRERYVEFPTTGSVYWVVVPVKVMSNFQRVYPKPLEALLSTASVLDPVSFGLEANFTRGNVRLAEDQAGQVSVESYEELHVYRFPNTIQISPSVGDILLNDNELEAFLTAMKKGWIA